VPASHSRPTASASKSTAVAPARRSSMPRRSR
jgi:hypothetical protein